MYSYKYFKYKYKYLKLQNNIKSGGTVIKFKDIIQSLIDSKIINSCQDIIKLSDINKEFYNNINWKNIESPHIVIHSSISELIENFIVNELNNKYQCNNNFIDQDTNENKLIKKNYRFYVLYKLKCKLQNLFEKYLFGFNRKPYNISKNIIREIIDKIITNQNCEQDYNFLIKLDEITSIESGLIAKNSLESMNIENIIEVIVNNKFISFEYKARLKNLIQKYLSEFIRKPYNISKNILREILENMIIYEYYEEDYKFLIKLGIDEITSIDSCRFENYSLEFINIPNTVEVIGIEAFYNNKLTQIIIPNNVKKIGKYAFSHNILSKIIIPNSLEEIDKYAFHNNKLTDIIIPNNVKIIKYGAFYYNDIHKISIPNKFKDEISKIIYLSEESNQKIFYT